MHLVLLRFLRFCIIYMCCKCLYHLDLMFAWTYCIWSGVCELIQMISGMYRFIVMVTGADVVAEAMTTDRGAVVLTLVADMVNRTLCNVNHKYCQYDRFTCHRNLEIYQTQEELEKLLSSHNVKSLSSHSVTMTNCIIR